MSYWEAIFLGIIQGLTEFLPVSSSGHLVLAQALLGVKQAGVTFEILVHLGSLLAVFIYFRKKLLILIKSLYDKEYVQYRKIILFIIIGTIPAVVLGLLLKDFFEAAFSSPSMAATMLLVTGAILLSTRFLKPGSKKIDSKRSLLVGIGQAVAIMPGISRSGSTIAAGLLLGLKPSEAAEFSFLLSIPVIAGATVLEFDALLALDSSLIGQYLAGMLFSFISAMFAVYAVMKIVEKGKIEYFAYYCFAAGMVGLYLFL